MKKTLLFLCLAIVHLCPASHAQRKCGTTQLKAALIGQNPEWEQRIETQRSSLQSIADNYLQQKTSNAAAKTTAASPIPVIFHIVVTDAQLAKMGGYAGVELRCKSQIEALNRDFNRENGDSTLIPSGWKPLYASTGIRFALAHTQPNGWGTPGYEVKIIYTSLGGFVQNSKGDYADAKHNATGGADAWDVTKYLNIWCVNFADDFGNIGLTQAKSFTEPDGSNSSEEGICLTYLAVGTQTAPPTLTFPPGGTFTKGRTLTHEMGHFFEIWHTWGDDFGKCTWTGGTDDGIADTPPEADGKYGIPVDTIAGGTIYDACIDSSSILKQPIGVATLDYMNYTDDVAMVMFTNQQAAVMASMVAPGGENYSLTQHPDLLTWPANTGVIRASTNNGLNISPNPSNGVFNISFNDITDELTDISVINTIGQEVVNMDPIRNSLKYYSIDLSAMNKGIYFVRCNFASGSITRKILLQ